jgi:hypothetical protein
MEEIQQSSQNNKIFIKNKKISTQGMNLSLRRKELIFIMSILQTNLDMGIIHNNQKIRANLLLSKLKAFFNLK